MTAISVSERLLEMAAFYTPLALTVTLICTPTESRKKCPDRHSGPGLLVIHQNRDQRASFRIV